jgi:hypothetical protein
MSYTLTLETSILLPGGKEAEVSARSTLKNDLPRFSHEVSTICMAIVQYKKLRSLQRPSFYGDSATFSEHL